MIDALLLAVKDSILAQPFGWDAARTLDIMDSGHPPEKTAGWFVAIHGGDTRGDSLNNRDEYFDYSLTLTKTLDGVTRDRIGSRLLTDKMAKQIAAKLAKETGFNACARQLSVFLDSNWAVIGLANQYLLKMYASADKVYGFCEPAYWEHTEHAQLMGGEWIGSDATDKNVAIKAEIRFVKARRLQPKGVFT